jgi:FKBP-type peptidyl-prolyl cis-trans isomerase
MKRIGLTLLAVCLLVLPLAGCTDLNTDKAKVSYAIGQDIGRSVAQFKDQIDLGALKQGLEDSLSGKEPRLDPVEARRVMQEFQNNARTIMMEKSKADGERNLKEGAEFLDKNAKMPGVTVTKSGLQMLTLTEGSGAVPKATDAVKVHYRGTLLDGREFDSSYQRNEPAVFPVTQVIKGWTEALQRMKVGGKYKLFVPPDIAYGAQGAGNMIGPNATLIFEVELLGIEKNAPRPAVRVQ